MFLVVIYKISGNLFIPFCNREPGSLMNPFCFLFLLSSIYVRIYTCINACIYIHMYIGTVCHSYLKNILLPLPFIPVLFRVDGSQAADTTLSTDPSSHEQKLPITF